MKKQGFTLAEVLITLGIVGVVAALTAPALIQNASMAKVGPSLKKAAAALETAHEQLMQEEEISDLNSLGGVTQYLDKLTEQLQGSSYEESLTTTPFNPGLRSYSGSVNNVPGYILHLNTGVDVVYDKYNGCPSAYKATDSLIGCMRRIYVDINGIKTKPNIIAKDVFLFYVDRSGIVVPIGGNLYSAATGYKKYTETGSKCDKTGVDNGWSCAGSIFENNLKVIYK